MVSGLWINETQYRVTDPKSGRSEVVTIPDEESLRDNVYRQELEHKAREWVESDWKERDASPRRAYNAAEKKDLAGTLTQIRASRKHRRESLHGRWW